MFGLAASPSYRSPHRPPRSPRAWVAALALLLGALAPGCTFDAEDIGRWENVAQGEQRLAGYLADPARPLELRQRAAFVLLRMDQIEHIVGVLKDAGDQDRERLLPYVVAVAVAGLRSDGPAAGQARAATLSFYLLQFVDGLRGTVEGQPRDAHFVQTVTDWCLSQFDSAQPIEPARRCDDILLAAATVRRDVVVPRLLDDMRQSAQLDRLLRVDALLAKLKDPAAHRQQGRMLLDFARRRYPQIEAPLAEAMVRNRNATLLRYLLDAARDPRVPRVTRVVAQEAALSHLGKRALPGLFNLLRTDEPDTGYAARFNALDMIWALGGVERLGDGLRALPADMSWPSRPGAFKAEVDAFCDESIARNAVTARPVLEQVVGHSNWAARAYAMECILRLYPDAAPLLLRGLLEDDTPLPGWSDDGSPITMGAYVQAALEPR